MKIKNLDHNKNRNKSFKIGVLTSAIMTVLSAGMGGSVALAQEAELEEVLVTGSRIRRQDFEANSPIVTVDERTFEETSTVGLETILNQLPQFIPGAVSSASTNAISASNGANQISTPGGGQFASTSLSPNSYSTPGTASVNLRGLGAGRNLVLIDGRRGMPVNASMTTDLNAIPSSALERIEVVSGGASAVYGADAVAGAVNFILRDNFEGLEINSNYGLTELGDAEEYRVNGLFGASTADGRGNVMLGVEHSHRGTGNFGERDWYVNDRANPRIGGTAFFPEGRYICGFLSFENCRNDNYVGPNGESQQDVIDSIFSQAAANGTPVSPSSHFVVNPINKTLYTGIFGNTNGGYRYEGFQNGDTITYKNGLPYKILEEDGGVKANEVNHSYVSVGLDRYSLFGRGNFEINDNLTAFANVTYARSNTKTKSGSAEAAGVWNASIPHGSGIFADSLAPNGVDTNADYRGVVDGSGNVGPGPLGLTCGPVGGCTNSEAFPVPSEVAMILATRPNPNAPFKLNHVMDYMGGRELISSSTNYQFQVGLEGDLDNGMYWDVAVSWGESETISDMVGYSSLDRYREVVQSANYGRLFSQQGNQDNFGLFGGTGSCISGLPIFEEFVATDDCISTIGANAYQRGLMQQSTFDASIGGTLMELPAGPLQFATGVAWRDNEYSHGASDVFNSYNFNNLLLGQAPVNSTFGQIKVREVFGELLVPLVSDGPVGIRELNLEIGGRYSDYYDTSGGVETFKFLADWMITDWMRFRGGYQLATRAPNIRELFVGRTLSPFASGPAGGDLCSLNNGDQPLSAAQGLTDEGQAVATAAQAAFTRGICEGLMGASAAESYYSQPINEMTEGGGYGNVYITGNPNVKPESADTYTMGLVMTSPFVDNELLNGLTVSVDWFNIKVTDMIAPDTGTIIRDRCFDMSLNTSTPASSNSFCQLIKRNPGNGSPYELDFAFSNDPSVNLTGIDLQVNWNAELTDLGIDFIPGGLGISMLATIPLKVETRGSNSENFVDWVGHQQGAGCIDGVSCTSYDYTMFTTFNWFSGPWNASLRWQRYPSIDHGALVLNPASTAIGVSESYDMFALTGGYRLNDNITLMAGIENLFDSAPPLGGGNPLSDPIQEPLHVSAGIYDPLGRRFYISANMSF